MNLTIQPKALFRSLLAAGFVLSAVFLNGIGPAKGQSIVLDFKFDTNGGANPSVFGSSNVNLTPGSAGQTYTVDIWATIFNGTPASNSPQDPTKFGLQSIAMRGTDDGGNAFTTGAGIGVVTGSFAELAPFNPPGFAQPSVTDLGHTTNGGSSATAGADGILDFGGTIAAQRLTIASNTGGPQYGAAGASVGSYSWEVGTFQFTIGQAGSANGARTQFWPTLLTAGQGSASADAFTAAGGAAVSGVTTLTVNPLTFTVLGAAGTTISVTPATGTASVLKGGAISLSKTINNTGSTALAAGDYTFAASGGTAISYTAMPSVPIPAPGSANFSTTASTTPGPGGTPIGLATVTFTATATGSAITNSPQSATTTLNVGGALADDSNTAGVYGPAISAVVPNGGSYAGLESAVVGLVNGPGGSNAAVTPFAPPWLGGDAKILAGTKSAVVTSPGVSMAWRTRLVGLPTGGQLSETHGGPGSALQATTTTSGLASDVVNITGLETGSPNAGSTDPFVLDMTYNPGLLPKGGPAAIEANLAKNKLIYMVSPSPGPDNGVSQYVNTVALNTGNVITSPLSPSFGFVGSYAFFQSAGQPGNGLSPAQELGAWGADPVNHEVWAVVNHNSTFAVVPEPATILLAGLGLLGLFGLRRTKKTA